MKTFQLTLNNNEILKCYMSNEVQNLKTLELGFLESDYSIDELKAIFCSDESKNNIKNIYKFTSDGIPVCIFKNYTNVRSIKGGIEKISNEVLLSIPTENSSGVTVDVDVPTKTEQEINVITVILDYEDPTVLEIENLKKELTNTKNENNKAIAELSIALASMKI